MRAWIVFVFLLAGQFANVSGGWAQAQNEERLRLVRADVLRSEIVNGSRVRIVEGNVEFQQGDATMTCNRAEWYVDEGRSVLRGNVVIVQKGTRLTADQVAYFDRSRTTLATGHVVLDDEGRIMESDSLWYYRHENKALARGRVVMTDSLGRPVLTGGPAQYDRDRDYVRVLRSPVLVQKDSLGVEELRVTSDQMEIFEGGARTRAAGHVVITKDSTTARCGEAEYFKKKGHFVLRQKPVAVQGRQEIHGDQIDLWLKDNQLDRVEVLKGAEVISRIDTLPGADLVNRLTGERMTLYLEDEQLRRVIIVGRAYSTYHVIDNGQATGTNEAIGDTMTLQFDHGRLKRVSISSSPGSSVGRLFPSGLKPSTPLAPTKTEKPEQKAKPEGR